MALTFQTFIIIAGRRQRLSYGPGLADFHHNCKAAPKAVLRPWPFRLSSSLHGGAKGCHMALTLQDLSLQTRPISTAALQALEWHGPCRLPSYAHGGAKGFLMALTIQTLIVFERRYLRLSHGCHRSDLHHSCTAVQRLFYGPDFADVQHICTAALKALFGPDLSDSHHILQSWP